MRPKLPVLTRSTLPTRARGDLVARGPSIERGREAIRTVVGRDLPSVAIGQAKVDREVAVPLSHDRWTRLIARTEGRWVIPVMLSGERRSGADDGAGALASRHAGAETTDRVGLAAAEAGGSVVSGTSRTEVAMPQFVNGQVEPLAEAAGLPARERTRRLLAGVPHTKWSYETVYWIGRVVEYLCALGVDMPLARWVRVMEIFAEQYRQRRTQSTEMSVDGLFSEVAQALGESRAAAEAYLRRQLIRTTSLYVGDILAAAGQHRGQETSTDAKRDVPPELTQQLLAIDPVYMEAVRATWSVIHQDVGVFVHWAKTALASALLGQPLSTALSPAQALRGLGMRWIDELRGLMGVEVMLQKVLERVVSGADPLEFVPGEVPQWVVRLRETEMQGLRLSEAGEPRVVLNDAGLPLVVRVHGARMLATTDESRSEGPEVTLTRLRDRRAIERVMLVLHAERTLVDSAVRALRLLKLFEDQDIPYAWAAVGVTAADDSRVTPTQLVEAGWRRPLCLGWLLLYCHGRLPPVEDEAAILPVELLDLEPEARQRLVRAVWGDYSFPGRERRAGQFLMTAMLGPHAYGDNRLRPLTPQELRRP